MTRIIPIILILISCSSNTVNLPSGTRRIYSNVTNDCDTLFSLNEEEFEYGFPCGFVNKKGDTVIQVGTFDRCFTDTFASFAYVYDKKLYGNDVVAINRDKEVIFDAFLFDNSPDFISDGLFRIKRNGKIGYANDSGKVIIEPKYECAYAFENGKAKVAYNCKTKMDDLDHSTWESSNWFYIDKNGNKIN